LICIIYLVLIFYYFILIKKAIGNTLPSAIGKIVKYLEFFSEDGFSFIKKTNRQDVLTG